MLHKCPQLASRRRVVIDSAATCVRNWCCQCWWPLTQQLHSSLVRLVLFSHNLSFQQNVSKINYSITCHIRTNVATGWSGYRKILIARIAKLDLHFCRYRCSNNTLKYFNNYKTLPLTDFQERVVDRVQVFPLSWEELQCYIALSLPFPSLSFALPALSYANHPFQLSYIPLNFFLVWDWYDCSFKQFLSLLANYLEHEFHLTTHRDMGRFGCHRARYDRFYCTYNLRWIIKSYFW